MTLSPLLVALMFVANGAHNYPDISVAVVLGCTVLLLIFFYNMDSIFEEAIESYKVEFFTSQKIRLEFSNLTG